MFQTKVIEQIKTHITFNNYFRNSWRLLHLEKYGRDR